MKDLLQNSDAQTTKPQEQSNSFQTHIQNLYEGLPGLSAQSGGRDLASISNGNSIDFSGLNGIYPGETQSAQNVATDAVQQTSSEASSTGSDSSSATSLTSLLQQVEQEFQQILNLLEGGSSSGGSGSTGTGGDGGTTSGGGGSTGTGGDGGTTSGGGGSTGGEGGSGGLVTGGSQLYGATGTDVAPIDTVTHDPGDGSTVITNFNTPAESTNLATTGNTNADALTALQQISANSLYSSGMAGSIDVSKEMSDPNSPGFAAIQQLESASGDKNFVNDFVNAVNQDVIPVGNAGIEGASSRWNSNQTLGYAWQGGEDPLGNMSNSLAEVQQQNPGLSGQALVNAVVQNMGNAFAQQVTDSAQQAADSTTPFINH
ncbi:MAG TPA: hypothetical protein V6C81_08365 [Planktothrix sp.]|jgi:hypothetical protein